MNSSHASNSGSLVRTSQSSAASRRGRRLAVIPTSCPSMTESSRLFLIEPPPELVEQAGRPCRKSLSIVLALRPMATAISRWVRPSMRCWRKIESARGGSFCSSRSTSRQPALRIELAFRAGVVRGGIAQAGRQGPTIRLPGAAPAPRSAGGRSSSWSRPGTDSCAARRSAPAWRRATLSHSSCNRSSAASPAPCARR